MNILFIANTALILGLITNFFLKDNKKRYFVNIFTSFIALGVSTIPLIAINKNIHLNSFSFFSNLLNINLKFTVEPISSLFLVLLFLLNFITDLNFKTIRYSRISYLTIRFLQILLVSSISLLLTSDNAFAFVFLYEIMSICSFLLIFFSEEKSKSTKAGFTYIVASQISAFFIFILFFLLSKEANSLDFNQFQYVNLTSQKLKFVILLTIAGFGIKAGLAPFHIWVPKVYSNLPENIAPLFTGFLGKIGIFGIIKVFSILAIFKASTVYIIIGIGLLSALIGIVNAINQKNLSKVLAYSSTENMGVILTAIGVSILGKITSNMEMAVFAFIGAIIHLINHSIFKSYLFILANKLKRITKSLEVDQLGGIYKSLPSLGKYFALGSLSISPIPPGIGFLGEFIILISLFSGVLSKTNFTITILTSVILAFVSALVIVTFIKNYAFTFLGERRNLTEKYDSSIVNFNAIKFQTLLLLVLPIIYFKLIAAFKFLVFDFLSIDQKLVNEELINLTLILKKFSLVAVLLTFSILVLYFIRKKTLTNTYKKITWDCGYALPNNKMQYTASSFTDSISNLLFPNLNFRKKILLPIGYFPKKSSVQILNFDFVSDLTISPIFERLRNFLSKFQKLQHGNLSLYLMYLLITFIILMTTKI